MMSVGERKDRRRIELPPQAGDFSVTFGGREIHWLSRLVGAIGAWMVRRRRGPSRRG